MTTRRASQPGSARRTGSRSAFAVAILLGIIVASSSSALAAGGAPSTAPGSTAVGTAAHLLPTGATAGVDDATWALADRLTSPTYTADTTAALVEGLAQAGVATFADSTSIAPEVPLDSVPSPFGLLDFQAHALAVGAWAGSDWSGSQIDNLMPLPAHSDGIAPASVLLAAYVAVADTPGGALSRALMAGQDLLQPSTLQFPGVVLVLFASDLATAGGQVAVPEPSPSSSSSTGSVPGRSQLVALALDGRAADVAAAPAVSGGYCSDVANWIHSRIDWLFNALKVAASSNPFLAFFGSIWNFVVDRLHAFVEGVITSVTDTILGTVRSIAATIAAVAEQVASILPYAVKLAASGGNMGSSGFLLGTDPLAGQVTASVTAGDLPDWPPVLKDCAAVAKVTLPDFSPKNVPVSWAQVQPAGNPMLASSGTPSKVTDNAGKAVWAFVTSTDPGDSDGPQRTQQDSLSVAVHRPELDRIRNAITNALLGYLPSILRPVVGQLLAPTLNDIQAKLNKELDATGTGYVEIEYHDKVPPTPGPSSACSPNPVVPGTYNGTTTVASTEVIDLGVSGGINDRSDGTGTATIVIAGDGSASGSWDMVEHDVFDETAKVDGVTGLADHRESTWTFSGGTVTGTACNLGLAFGTIVVTSCVDSLKGDCTGDPIQFGSSPAPTGLGAPVSVSGGHVTWTVHYVSSGDVKATSDLTVVVSSTTP